MFSKKIGALFLGLLLMIVNCGHDVATITPPPQDTPDPEENENEVETTGVITAMKSYDPPFHVGDQIYTDKWSMKGDQGGHYLMYVTPETEIRGGTNIRVGHHVSVKLEQKKTEKPSKKYYIVWIQKLS